MGRGVIRRTKRRRNPGKVVGMMRRRALDYLEKELKLALDSPGNAEEVARILRILEVYDEPEPTPESNGRSALQRQFGFDPAVAPQRDEPAEEPDDGGDPEA